MSRLALINPNTAFFLQKSLGPYGTQNDLLAFAVELKCVTGIEMKFFAQSLGNENAAGAVESDFCSHNGSICWSKTVTRSEMEPAFPREGAKDVLDNARVRMWDYTFDVKKPTGVHVHEHDAVEVFVTGGTLRFKTADGQEEIKTYATKDARFVPRGRVDAEEVVAGSPRVIAIELK